MVSWMKKISQSQTIFLSRKRRAISRRLNWANQATATRPIETEETIKGSEIAKASRHSSEKYIVSSLGELCIRQIYKIVARFFEPGKGKGK